MPNGRSPGEIPCKKLKAWLWFALATVLIGVFLLYPIGSPFWNVCFLLVKAGMCAGILRLMRGGGREAFRFWAVFSGLAVLMTIVKWILNGPFIWTYALAIITDIAVPWIAYKLRQE
jgi:hypothetical protein